MIPLYSRVRILTDRFSDLGISTGAVGTTIEDWGDGNFEIDISDSEGTTLAMFVAHESEFELADGPPSS